MLLFDENLAVRLVTDLTDLYPGCLQLSDRGLGAVPTKGSGNTPENTDL